ncbi:hypothetical protein DH2020_009244 [Rehmannia glutinosa]|uniref:Protein kinase domain-containing protein n=1 Tax=Rehmannia glutinosa TaxID=99300 RepID=A0ABR0X8A5_REHGL
MNLYPVSIAFLFLCFLNATTADNSNPTQFTADISINCGSFGTSAASNGREWMGDVLPKYSSLLQIEGSSTTSTVIHKLISADPVPHKTARISHTQFSYAFQVNPGQKILRLHFNPSPYKGFKGFKDLFTVEAGPFTLLSNFSASLTADALGVKSFSKEFCLNIQKNEQFNVTFSPESSQSQDTYAFINGIEIISVPASLSYFHGGDIGVQEVGKKSLVYVDQHTALEMIHRLNIKESSVLSSGDFDDTFPIWALRKADKGKNNNWKIPVDVGFRYMIRIHFTEIGLNIAGTGDVMFKVLINDMIAQTNIDMVRERDENSIPRYRDYMVMLRGQRKEGKRDLLISLHSYDDLIGGHGLFAGIEVFKLSNPDNSLASPNPMPLARDSPSHTIQILLLILGHRNAFATIAITIISLVNIIVHKLREYWEANNAEEENKPSARSQRLCRRFSLAEIQLATRNFSVALLIGRGGFGKVYKGLIDRGQKAVAVKRLRSNSNQGAHEFLMEIETLSELRHVNLVSLIGYCNEHREMILVYDYMAGGTLADQIYKLPRESNNCPPLRWKQRLNICIGAGRGLDYLHTGHGVIHRDVKTSNILLDDNFIAKVSDFGLAKHENRSKIQSHVSTRVKGTNGYLDPHYLQTSKLTRKTDTYAFGVVLLVVLCGRPALDFGIAEDEQILSKWARGKIIEGEIDHIIDLIMRDEISPDSLETFVEVTQRCLHDEPKNRPTMSEVVRQLEIALGQQDNRQILVLNEISRAYDDIHHSNDIDVSVNREQPTMNSSHVQFLTHPPEEQINTKAVSAEIPSTRKDGRKATTHKPSRVWPWNAFWKRVKSPKKNESSSEIWEEANIKSANFDWDTIVAATNQFSSSDKVVHGGFGSVYKGVLPTGQIVAIKRLSLSSIEFRNKILLLPNLQHQNVTKLLGYCIHGEENFLVYEFMENTSLDTFIFGEAQRRQRLPWPVRFEIIWGIARGVAYLHHDSGLGDRDSKSSSILGDLKTNNILLDSEMNPKISGFGFAKALVEHQFDLETIRVASAMNVGYISPERLMDGKLSDKSSVYSFGIIVLEVMSGKRTSMGIHSDPIHAHAWKLWNEGRALDLVDESLGGAFSSDEALRCIKVGLLCTQLEPYDRPEMISVLRILQGEELQLEPGPGREYPTSSSLCIHDGLVDSNATFEFDDDTLQR